MQIYCHFCNNIRNSHIYYKNLTLTERKPHSDRIPCIFCPGRVGMTLASRGIPTCRRPTSTLWPTTAGSCASTMPSRRARPPERRCSQENTRAELVSAQFPSVSLLLNYRKTDYPQVHALFPFSSLSACSVIIQEFSHS